MSASRRYEILLPLRFNDGQLVPDELISDTLIELENHFGAIAWETQVIRGHWRQEEDVWSHVLMRDMSQGWRTTAYCTLRQS
jgi:hypothetical protein